MRKPVAALVVLPLIVILTASSLPVSAIDTLTPSDFQQGSWYKTIDFLDYVRAYASQLNQTPPPSDSHAFMYLTYVNSSGMQMLYAGLSNITDQRATLTIPLQTFMMHYKSRDQLQDVVTASSFVMLLAFNETDATIHADSPDRSDMLYASFSLGLDLGEYVGGGTFPSLATRTEVIPLEPGPGGLTWTWGMRYTNLTAVWWSTSIDPEHPSLDPRPVAISRYEELTFRYKLVIDPDTGKATIRCDYVIGRILDLWVFSWLVIVPVSVHYNATGCYRVNGATISGETVYDFLRNQGIKMSIVQFQGSATLNRTTYAQYKGTNVTDSEVRITDSSISTFASNGEKVFDAEFYSKRQYNLYNYTADKTEKSFKTYDTTVWTGKVAGFAHNPIFLVHASLMRLIPHVLVHMHPALYWQARDHLLDMDYADYFSITAYPTYEGYRVVHDPTYTAYAQLTKAPAQPSALSFTTGLALVAAGMAVIAVFVVLVTRRRR